MKHYTISGLVREIDAKGFVYLAAVTLDGAPFSPHMLLRPSIACTVGERVEIRCTQDARGRYVPCAD